jgi:FlaG/FlaF family flagellin (archaellin)
MLSNRYSYTVALLAVLVATFVNSTSLYAHNYAYYKANNESHNLIIGSRQPGDRLVYQENISKESQWLQIVEVQKTFNVSYYSRITQVRALDQKTNGNGATATCLANGPGFNNVTLKFKSKRGHGIRFVVELYTKPWY